MERTMIGVFDSEQEANTVRQELIDCGIADERVHLRQGTLEDVEGARAEPREQREDHRNWFERLFGIGDDDSEHYGQYAEAVRRGHCLVVVDEIDDARIDEASDIMSRHGAIDIERRATEWRGAGWTGSEKPAAVGRQAAARRQASAAPQSQSDENRRIPVVEEELKVGKRTVDRGGVRIYTRATERPVEEDVSLREEHARVERHAVDRAATEAEQAQAFKDATVEIRETAEEPVVSKSARVVEEVEIGKEASERTETVRDTVRRTDVQVENLDGQSRSASAGSRGGMAATSDSAGAASADGMDVADLNEVLRDELSAMETYRQALDKNRDEYASDARFQQLEQILRDHEQAAMQLRNMIRQMGGAESNDSGAWGTWANTVMGTAKIFGDKAALKALKEGEESGIKDYQEMLDDRTPSADVKRVLMSIMDQERQHVQQLDRLIESA